MPLDFVKVSAQITAMVSRLRDGQEARAGRLKTALDTLRGGALDLPALQEKIAAARTTWLVAEPAESLTQTYPTPNLPEAFTVVATDGSHIDVDRHRSTRCYLINTGSVALTYGRDARAELSSTPRLSVEEEELVIKTPGGGLREQPVEGALLGLVRSVAECRALAELAENQAESVPLVALVDGTLILWGLEAYPDFVADVLLHQGFLPCLDEIRKANHRRPTAMASYISFPRATDVVNTLRIIICPHQPADCDRCLKRECDIIAGVRDRELFSDILADGERSGVFKTQSSVVAKHYGEHAVCFCYLRAGDEIARLEMPAWVADDWRLLSLLHAAVYDQCRRGHGYPVALAEAHEQAVLTGADRRLFWEIMDAEMSQAHAPVTTSAKHRSKQTRWL